MRRNQPTTKENVVKRKPHSEETKLKIAAKRLGKKHSAETVDKIRSSLHTFHNYVNGVPVEKPIKVKRETKGYTYNKSIKRWTAQFRLNGKLHYVGSYQTELEAREAFLAAKKRLEVSPDDVNGLLDGNSKAQPSESNLGTLEQPE